MKSILIIDTPESCDECPLRSYSNLALWCTPLRKTKEDDDVCPLRPMPDKAAEMLLEGLDKIEILKNVKVSYVHDLMGETE